MRSELADEFPSHVAAAWLGHTEQIADNHYRQGTATHLQRATTEPTSVMPGQIKLAQKPAHSSAIAARQGSARNTKSPAIVGSDEGWGVLENARVAEEGLEPPTRGL